MPTARAWRRRGPIDAGRLVKCPERRWSRFLTGAEFARLGRVLDEVETEGGTRARVRRSVCR